MMKEIALSAFTPEEATQFLVLRNRFVQRFNSITRAPPT
jgi:hypothetical protein